MKSFSNKLRIAIVSLLVALPVFGATQALAQDQEFTPELYTSELTGFDVEVTGPEYEITGATLEHYQTGDGEIVNIEGELATLEVSFFDDEDTPEDSIDAYLAGLDQSGLEFEELERDVDGDVTHAIVLIDYEGVEIVYYMQVTEDVTGNVDLFETILTGVDFIEDDMEVAQEELTIDGAPFMENVDATDIVAAVEGGSSGADDDATPEATSEPATPETAVTFEIADVELGVSGTFQVDEEPLSQDVIEAYTITDDDLFAAVAVGETGFSAEATVTSFSEGLVSSYDDSVLIDSADNGDSAWALYEIEFAGATRVLFVYADVTTVEGFETLISLEVPADDLGDSIENVQDNLTIDGQPLLADVDANEIVALVTDGGVDEGNDTTTDVTPEATDDIDEDATEGDSPRDDAKLPGQDGTNNPSETNTSETNTEDENPLTEPTEEPVGQSGADSWTSPIYGNEVAWDADIWYTDLENADLVESDEAGGYEFVSLNADLSPVPAYMYIEFHPNSMTTADFMEHWTSDDYLQRETSGGDVFNGELLGTRNRDGSAGVVIRYSAGSNEFVMVREAVEMRDGSVMVITIDAETGDFSTAYESAHDTVTVNTESILNVFSVSQIERLTGE